MTPGALPSIGPVTGVVLAAGRGTRLAPVTDHTPKPLVPALGRPLLDHAVDALVAAGVTRVAVNAHHLAEKVEAHVRGVVARRLPRVAFEVSREATLLGTGGGLAQLAPWLGESPFYVLNADVLLSASVARFGRDALAQLAGHPARHAVLAMQRLPEERRLWRLRCDAGGSVLEVRRAPFSGPHDGGYAGLMVGTRALVDRLEPRESCVVWDGLVPWMGERRARGLPSPAGGVVLTGAWADTGTPEQLLEAHVRLRPHRAALLQRQARAARLGA